MVGGVGGTGSSGGAYRSNFDPQDLQHVKDLVDELQTCPDPAAFDDKKMELQSYLLVLQNKGELDSPDRIKLDKELLRMTFQEGDLPDLCNQMKDQLNKMVH